MLTSYFHLWYLVKLRFSMVSVWILSYFYLHYMILLMSSMTNVTDLLCFFLGISRVLLSYFHPCYYFFRLSIREVISSSGCTDHIPDDKSEVPWQSAPCLSPASPSHSVTPRPATKPQKPPNSHPLARVSGNPHSPHQLVNHLYLHSSSVKDQEF